MINLLRFSKIWLHLFLALLLSVFVVACLIEAEFSGLIPLYSIKVNPLTQLGKNVDDGVNHETGMLMLNVLDNVFFKNVTQTKKKKSIFIMGTSVATKLPTSKFSYNGYDYQTYDFGINGNPLYPTMKIFSLLSEFKPDIVFLAINPSQIDNKIKPDSGAFGEECLGALKNYKIQGAALSDKETCFFHEEKNTHFSWKRVAHNIKWLITPSKFSQEENLDGVKLFRATLSSLGADLLNSFYALTRLQKENPPLDLGNLHFNSIQQNRNSLLEEIAKEPNRLNHVPDFQQDPMNHWNTWFNPMVLKSNTAYAQMLISMIEFAKAKNIKLVFYTTPLAHNMPQLFPEGYYQDYQSTVRNFITRHGGYYLDEGDLVVGKGELMRDSFHLQPKGRSMLVKMLIYDAIANQWLDSKESA